jgi:AcrR family transcriptional regulator
MLDTAQAMVARSGLTVGLDHISFEDIINEAGVARTAVYRRWPYKDQFFGDLLRALAADARPFAEPIEAGHESWRDFAHRVNELTSDRARHDLITEMVRLAGANDLKAAAESVEWRTYLALQATFLSLPDGNLQDDIRAALANAERRFAARVADNWKQLAHLLGLRLRPGAGGSFELIATLASAALRGLVLMSLSDQTLPACRLTANPMNASSPADWSTLGMAAAAIAGTYLEPDPDIVWDEQRLTSIRDSLTTGLNGIGLMEPKSTATTHPDPKARRQRTRRERPPRP